MSNTMNETAKAAKQKAGSWWGTQAYTNPLVPGLRRYRLVRYTVGVQGISFFGRPIYKQRAEAQPVADERNERLIEQAEQAS